MEASSFNPLEQAKADADPGRAIYNNFMAPTEGEFGDIGLQAANDMVNYLESRPFEDSRGNLHNPDGKFTSKDKPSVFDTETDNTLREPIDYTSMSYSELAQASAEAEINGWDSTLIDDAVQEKILNSGANQELTNSDGSQRTETEGSEADRLLNRYLDLKDIKIEALKLKNRHDALSEQLKTIAQHFEDNKRTPTDEEVTDLSNLMNELYHTNKRINTLDGISQEEHERQDGLMKEHLEGLMSKIHGTSPNNPDSPDDVNNPDNTDSNNSVPKPTAIEPSKSSSPLAITYPEASEEGWNFDTYTPKAADNSGEREAETAQAKEKYVQLSEQLQGIAGQFRFDRRTPTEEESHAILRKMDDFINTNDKINLSDGMSDEERANDASKAMNELRAMFEGVDLHQQGNTDEAPADAQPTPQDEGSTGENPDSNQDEDLIRGLGFEPTKGSGTILNSEVEDHDESNHGEVEDHDESNHGEVDESDSRAKRLGRGIRTLLSGDKEPEKKYFVDDEEDRRVRRWGKKIMAALLVAGLAGGTVYALGHHEDEGSSNPANEVIDEEHDTEEAVNEETSARVSSRVPGQSHRLNIDQSESTPKTSLDLKINDDSYHPWDAVVDAGVPEQDAMAVINRAIELADDKANHTASLHDLDGNPQTTTDQAIILDGSLDIRDTKQGIRRSLELALKEYEENDRQ